MMYSHREAAAILMIVSAGLCSAGVAAAQARSAAKLAIPKTWDEKALREWATPLARINVRPSHISSAQYYAVPVENLKTWPIDLAGREPEALPKTVWHSRCRTVPLVRQLRAPPLVSSGRCASLHGGVPFRMGLGPLGTWLYSAFGAPWMDRDVHLGLKQISDEEYEAREYAVGLCLAGTAVCTSQRKCQTSLASKTADISITRRHT
jgi:hypothetical protein